MQLFMLTLWSVATLLTAGASAILFPRQADAGSPFDWSSITPSPDLQYQDCYGGYKCARLEVPLDWSQPNSTARAAIAILTIPVSVPENDPSFGGTLLFNPGGPGNSAIEFSLALGEQIRAVVDGEKHFEILAFDPRGVGMSTPSADCYHNTFNRVADTLQNMDAAMPPVAASDLGLQLRYSAAEALSKLCAQTAPGPDSIFAHMSTASVARDMLEIVERVDELRQTTQKRANSDKADRTDPLLQFYGISYGTMLGNTFASMFPDRIGRMVLDGIVDADDYLSGKVLTTIADAEKTIDQFYKTCYDAGDSCPLRQKGDKGPSDLRKRVDALLRSLEEEPVATVQDGRYRLVTSFQLRDTIRLCLYDPLSQYEYLAATLASSVAGDYSLLLQGPTVNPFLKEQACMAPDSGDPPAAYSWAYEAAVGVFCGDSYASAGKRNVSWAREAVRQQAKVSFTTGEVWSRLMLSCAGWEFDPKYAFHGPFGSPAPPRSKSDGTIGQAPLLILSNRYDHATPLRNAYALSKQHGGSSVVVQEAVGHTTLLSAQSACMARLIQDYYATGKVPRNGTTCKPDYAAQIPSKPCGEGVAATIFGTTTE
ncbi:Tripeptidyl aminopeptidase [Corynascus novoguineensis]|uniref:Tripeptidyl aminopeptidase n=1 Tax=Corynascus novoguineensis TaxID=1126955 RepID=A0AAN7CT28_9PEZI|nr:Tripeptidyl aminopeptidase [Corynascus novoguineensis]